MKDWLHGLLYECGGVRAIYEASEGEDSAPDPLGGGTNEKIDINYLRGARMIKIKRFHSTRRSLVDNVTVVVTRALVTRDWAIVSLVRLDFELERRQETRLNQGKTVAAT